MSDVQSSRPPNGPPRSASWNRARSLVLRHGWNAVAYQILNPGMELWFAEDGDAVVGYVTHAGVRVVAGAPVCARERLASVAAEFEDAATARRERVCYFGAGERLERVLASSASHAFVLLGAQPVWDPHDWERGVGRKASFRAQLRRARNKEVRVSEWPAATAHEHPALRRVLAEWLATRGLPPMHFLVEPETLGRLDDRRIFVAEQGGAVIAFLIATPVPAQSGWLIEQWPRGRAAPNGTVESLINEAMIAFASAGARYVTLGLSPLSRHAPPALTRVPLWLRLTLAWVRVHGRRFYDFDGLDAFKTKFAPVRWEPVYAIANDREFSPRMLYAIGGAFSNGSPVLFVARGLAWAVRQELRQFRAR